MQIMGKVQRYIIKEQVSGYVNPAVSFVSKV